VKNLGLKPHFHLETSCYNALYGVCKAAIMLYSA
jgi:hypothetical protein